MHSWVLLAQCLSQGCSQGISWRQNPFRAQQGQGLLPSAFTWLLEGLVVLHNVSFDDGEEEEGEDAWKAEGEESS